MCCCSIKFTLKARSAISWIHIHKLLNGSRWSYISWSKKKRYCNDLNIQTMRNRSTLNIHVLQTVHSLASHLTVSELVSQEQIMEYACKKHFQFGKKKKKKLNQMIKERHCHANRAVISLITAALTAVNCTSESLFLQLTFSFQAFFD